MKYTKLQQNNKIVCGRWFDAFSTGADVCFDAFITDKNGTVIPNYSGIITFKIEGNAELIGENPVSCIAGIASSSIKTTVNLKDIKLTATPNDAIIASATTKLK